MSAAKRMKADLAWPHRRSGVPLAVGGPVVLRWVSPRADLTTWIPTRPQPACRYLRWILLSMPSRWCSLRCASAAAFLRARSRLASRLSALLGGSDAVLDARESVRDCAHCDLLVQFGPIAACSNAGKKPPSLPIRSSFQVTATVTFSRGRCQRSVAFPSPSPPCPQSS